MSVDSSEPQEYVPFARSLIDPARPAGFPCMTGSYAWAGPTLIPILDNGLRRKMLVSTLVLMVFDDR